MVFGADSKNHLSSLQTNSHSEICFDYQNFFLKLVRQFSGLTILKEFWTVSFQRPSSQVGSHKSWLFVLYTYITIFLVSSCFFSYQKRFFCGLKLSSAANLVLNWVCPVLSFPERFQPITAAAVCTVAMNVLEPGAFNAESQYFIPLFNRISRLCGQRSRGDEASNGGCNSGLTGHDFLHNTNIWFLLFTMRIGPFSKSQNRLGSQIECQVKTWPVLISSENLQSSSHHSSHLRFSLAGSHWELNWKLTPVFTQRVRPTQHWLWP